MKIKILALLGLLVPIAAMSQTEPMKGATRITVNTSDVAATNYKMTLTKLLDLGIFIEAKDPELFTIRTQLKRLPKTSGSFFLNIRCKDDIILISGKVKAGFDINVGSVKTVDDFDDISNKGMNGSILKSAFTAMNTIALQLGTDPIYSK